MTKMAFTFVFIVSVSVAPKKIFTQTSMNPDISIIPDFRTSTTTEKGVPEKNKINFSLEEIEAAIQAPLNPYARADVFIAFVNDETAPVDIEEAYFTIQKGLPWNFNLKGGKFLVDFSKLNTAHPHAYPFVYRPLYQENFFGEEGLKDVGLELNTLMPTGDTYTKISGTVSTGDELDGERKNLFFAGRISSFFQLSDLSAFEAGFGSATGVTDTIADRFKWFNADIKYKWKKDQYTSFTLWGEALMSRFRGLNTYGGYIAGNYQSNGVLKLVRNSTCLNPLTTRIEQEWSPDISISCRLKKLWFSGWCLPTQKRTIQRHSIRSSYRLYFHLGHIRLMCFRHCHIYKTGIF